MNNNNNNKLGSRFLSGYKGGFLGMNRNQQNTGGFLGMNRNHQQQYQSGNPACLQNERVRSLLSTESVAEKDNRVRVSDVRDLTPGGFTMTSGKERIAGPRYVSSTGAMNINGNSSDEDERSMDDGNGDTRGLKGKKDAPWQRMKWTDKIVRLLIQVVANVGEDGSLEGADGARQKSGIIKKGKWKTVSKVLFSKGFHVSPQQCEDKFNDLNKRYKKLNDILGRGTSCRVVENPALLNNMEHLSAKAKEDVRKLLSSKHLFYKEMCAYHNGQKIPDCNVVELPLRSVSVAVQDWKDRDGSPVAAQGTNEKDGSPVAAQRSKDTDISEEESAESENDMAEDVCGSVEKIEKYGNGEMENGEDGYIESQCGREDDFEAVIAKNFNDPTKSAREQREWIKKRKLQLQEERISIQAEALELDKRRLKWQRFCNKKELELDTARLEKERLMIENERMALQLKQKEVEVEFRRSESSFSLASFSIDIMQGREQIDLGRKQ